MCNFDKKNSVHSANDEITKGNKNFVQTSSGELPGIPLISIRRTDTHSLRTTKGIFFLIRFRMCSIGSFGRFKRETKADVGQQSGVNAN